MLRLDEFVNNIVKSRLLAPDDLIELRARFSPEPAADAAVRLARLLIEVNKLTAYQARKLLGGATKGFFLGRYRILRRLGKGGMGKVFLARAPGDRSDVAIKVLPPTKALENEHAISRFQREIDLSQRIGHPNLTRTLGVGEADGVHFMVMEYVPGESLFDMVRGRGRGPWRVPDAARYFTNVLNGLEAAHAAGLVHRDLKPANLMVTPNGDAKILDLGLARDVEEPEQGRLTNPNLIVGTLDYASPEQLADAASADHRSDIYSLGCTLYFALAGHAPFPGGDAINKIYKQRMVDPPLLERCAPGVPPAFAAIVRKMMAKNPSDRYQDVPSLRADLARWLDPNVTRRLVGDKFEVAHAFLPPQELDDADLRLLADSAGSSGGLPGDELRVLGDAEPAPAARNARPDVARPAKVIKTHPATVPPKPSREPAGSANVWLLQLVAAVCAILALLTVYAVFFRR